jgi:hypothetical protein
MQSPASGPALARDSMFRDDLGSYDENTGVFYTNLFDKIVDAVYAAMNATGYPDVELLIGEVSWGRTLVLEL